ncbi:MULTISPECIES: hypothetical protein [unclassified Pedobacter]|uniref:hypothetical protein n=1 Tax=unclassified Pedobacter TaxID=2628915 RepID=UPI00110F614C|nr:MULTISPECIES: hypothetical protein [unclassified Pedobacter]MDQ0965795.1 putative membrane protein [Flavobacterium sp. W4I14]QDW24955.1 hypothetical protein FFJ24_009075 [Pedobacter sp. KBS0701]CAH0149531.1 hypothetical protein SRABI36_00756 [Pedobacter sp. Bi36]CAH0205561.1 hypothetical protein SRABI126_01848 [Pedobacter sp. Bi126]CAH0263850.1 hypothetical protein SRABI27_03296 [Pedobacter sp. Bi27]
MNRTLGIILIVVGIAMLIWTGFSYTKKEKIVDAGPIQISADKEKSVNWPPYAGGIILVAGVIVFVASKKK